MLSVGLTGGIASGKSTVSRMFADLGARVIDSDAITHELLEPGKTVHEAVVNAFGPEILRQDGTIDRRRLGAVVFSDPERRAVLNGIVHPAVHGRQDQFLRSVADEAPDAVAIVDAALMIETGSHARYDRVIVVSCERSQQVARLRERGWTEVEALSRIDAQMPVSEKRTYADYVIDNSGTLEATRAQVERVWSVLLEEAQSGGGRRSRH